MNSPSWRSRRTSEDTCRDEREAPQDEITNLDGTKMEQREKDLLEYVRREMCPQFETINRRLQVLEERPSQEAANGIYSYGSRSWNDSTNKSQSFSQKDLSRIVSVEQFHQKEKECEKLREEKRAIEEKLQEVLAKTFSMQNLKSSENLCDPSRESVVLEMYDILRAHEWEKARCDARDCKFLMTYEHSSKIIKAVFHKCEEDLSQKICQIFELLEIPISNETTILFDNEQLPLVREIKTHLRNLYLNYGEDIYQSRSRTALPSDVQRFLPVVNFAAKCYKIYCLLLLQNPPIRAVGHRGETISTAWLEHVDKKDEIDRMSLKILWPLLACKTTLLRKGVVYD